MFLNVYFFPDAHCGTIFFASTHLHTRSLYTTHFHTHFHQMIKRNTSINDCFRPCESYFMIFIVFVFALTCMLMVQNAFGSPDVSTANARLLRPAQHVLQADPKGNCYQMAALGPGMQVRAGAGVGSMQFRVVTTVGGYGVTTGLVPAGASVAGHRCPGCEAGTPGGGWAGSGCVAWSLPGPAPASSTVRFGQGDRVMVVLDCRQEPLVRLLVNSRQRQVHHLAPPAGGSIAILCPAIALYGDGFVAGSVEVEAGAPLPDGWDTAPS